MSPDKTLKELISEALDRGDLKAAEELLASLKESSSKPKKASRKKAATRPVKRVVTAEDFRVEQRGPSATETREDGRVVCKARPFVPVRNKWKDDGSHAEEAKLDRLMTRNIDPSGKVRRPPAEALTVNIPCGTCKRKFDVDAAEANRTVEGEPVEWLCGKCIRNAIRG